jgi:hypothetical protein
MVGTAGGLKPRVVYADFGRFLEGLFLTNGASCEG